MVRLESADPAGITPELAQTVRGIAAFGGISAAFIDALPKLEIIASFGVGYDSVDAAHAGKQGVMVTNTPDVLTEEVADTALGLLINTVRELPRAENYLRAGRWAKEGPYRLTPATLRGRKRRHFRHGPDRAGDRAAAGGVRPAVAYHNRRQVEGLAYEYHPTLVSLAGAVDTLISVVPGGASTLKAVDAEVLKALGPNGVFVNIGRGSTVDEDALAAALRDGTIFAAGLDVFADEPNVPQGAARPAQRLAAAACRLGVGAHAQRHGRSRRRQSGVLVLEGRAGHRRSRDGACEGEALATIPRRSARRFAPTHGRARRRRKRGRSLPSCCRSAPSIPGCH